MLTTYEVSSLYFINRGSLSIVHLKLYEITDLAGSGGFTEGGVTEVTVELESSSPGGGINTP